LTGAGFRDPSWGCHVIGHYLTHTAEIDAYLFRRRAEAIALQRTLEARFNPIGIRARVLARQAERVQ
jgi:hypothetical protein